MKWFHVIIRLQEYRLLKMLSREELVQRLSAYLQGVRSPASLRQPAYHVSSPASQARRGGLGHERAGIVTRESVPLKTDIEAIDK